MILKALALENFKGIHEPVRIEFAPVTLLFGPNNAGKSTIVQALHYARRSAIPIQATSISIARAYKKSYPAARKESGSRCR